MCLIKRWYHSIVEFLTLQHIKDISNRLEKLKTNACSTDETCCLEHSLDQLQTNINDMMSLTTAITNQLDIVTMLPSSQAKALMRAVSDGIVVLDQDWIIQDWNTGAQKLLGYSKQEIINRSFDDIIPPIGTFQDHSAVLNKSHIRCVCKNKDGTFVNLVLKTSTFSADGKNKILVILRHAH